jgi:hypothetical protein
MSDDPRPESASNRDVAEENESSLPALPARLVAVFFSPGRLMDELVLDPRWIGALLAGAALVGLSVALIPVDVFMEMNRQAALERGAEFPEMTDRALEMMRVVIPLGSVVSTLAFTAVFTGVYTIIFAFVLGDEGRFRQYLAVVSHAYFIPLLFGLLVTPLRISTGDPQFTLNLASFFVFLPDGYVLNVLRVFDLTQIWSTLVIAQGVHAIDRRRSFSSAAAILLVLFSGTALIIARFM